MKLKCLLPFSILLLLSSGSFSQGIRLEEKTERFVLKQDRQVGIIILDNQQNLEWNGCLVGQDYSNGQCNGVPQRMKWPDASSVARKAGNRWRLPTVDELNGIMAPKMFKNDRVRHLSKLFDEGNSTIFVYWTSTGVTDMPNHHWVVAGTNDLPSSGISRRDPIGIDVEEYEVRLVRDKK